jgi:hypothetical protein
VIPRSRPHEQVAFGLDERSAWLTGAYSCADGWNGITIVDLLEYSTRKVAAAAWSLDIIVLGDNCG